MDGEENAYVNDVYGLGLSHNKFALPLPDGTNYPEFAQDSSGKRAREFLTHFDRVRDRDWADCSFLDLGSSEGSTTLELSQMGSTVHGVEGRADAVERARAMTRVQGFDNTHFTVGDVNDPASYPSVDGVFNAGILYHLEDPVQCLERTAAAARAYVYLDTGHAPTSDEMIEASKFKRSFGRFHTISAHGLTLGAMDFAEPTNTSERNADGTRRGPRSGIGNSNSVWLTHESTIALMAALGFAHHETLSHSPTISRNRTVFFREPPRAVGKLPAFTHPLPTALPRDEAIARARRRDLAYLRASGEPVILLGREPMMGAIAAELADNGIAIAERIVVPGEGLLSTHAANELTRGRGGRVVVAMGDVVHTMDRLVVVDRFDYAFTSFALARGG